ncbi:MAG: acyltransferase [Bacteroidota bacterium]
MKNKVWFLNLDGLRFLAFLSVFLSHSFYTKDTSIFQSLYPLIKKLIYIGSFGVDFFFVLSSYLITYSLLTEEALTNHINIPRFYARRLLRIWPLYYVCLLFGFLIFPLFKSFLKLPQNEVANPLLYFTFLGNFDYILNGSPITSFLGVFWSVAIEEQFYLTWPIILVLVKSRRAILFISLIAISIVFRYTQASNETVLYFHTLSTLSALATGALSAWLCLTFTSFTLFFKNLKKTPILLIYIVGILLILNVETIFIGNVLIAFERVIIAIFFSFVILEQNYAKHSVCKITSFRLLSNLGKYTYGLYCLHLIVLLFISSFFGLFRLKESIFTLAFQSILALLVSLASSWVSYHYFEKHFLQWKKKFV